MRSLQAVFLCALLSLTMVGMAHANPADITTAAQALQKELGTGKAISSSEGPVVLQALESAAISKPELLGEMAALLAAARPELAGEIKKSITVLALSDVDATISKMELAAVSPTIDQLAALAALEGAAPASGGNVVSSEDLDSPDLGWAGYGAENNGSAD